MKLINTPIQKRLKTVFFAKSMNECVILLFQFKLNNISTYLKNNLTGKSKVFCLLKNRDFCPKKNA